MLPRKNRRGTRAGGEGVFLAHFQKLEKMCPNLGKNGLIVVIYGKHFLFKTQFFKSFQAKKPEMFSMWGFSFSWLQNVY